ncbi:hypothetical protein H4R99_004580 [Coemansia sp. RSA 1722]|nr:hypothetical protein H4R99_004580 [Coemansia sp. RSA 1722]KAJ2640061.1 hypothetical protein GGF40_000423 [Coemansia sp. RSA 1286]
MDMSRPARTKGESTDRQTQTPVDAEGIASRHAPDLENCPASSISRLGLCKQKMDLILRYLENHFSMPQETPGTPLLPSDAGPSNDITDSDANAGVSAQVAQPKCVEDEALAVDTVMRRHKGKRPLRRSLVRPNTIHATNSTSLPHSLQGSKGESTDEQVVYGSSSRHNSRKPTAHLGTIQSLPKTALSNRQPKNLGIFNKGKAVVSSSGTGIAFSEAEFLKTANIERLLVDRAEQQDSAGDSADVGAAHSTLRQAPADNVNSRTSISRRSANNSKNSSHAVERNEAAANAQGEFLQQQQPCEILVRTSPVSRSRSCNNSRRSSRSNRSSSQSSVEAFRQFAAPLSAEDEIPNYYSDLLPAHESWQQDAGAASAAFAAAAPEVQVSPFMRPNALLQPESAQLHGLNALVDNTPGASPRLHTSFVRSLLMNSIAECLNEEDADRQSTPMHTTGDSNNSSRSSINNNGNAMDLDVSMLFDRHGAGLTCDTSYSRFNMRNDCSIEGISGINSSFFASQDMPYQRCLGETTISDFGLNRYGNAYNPSIYHNQPIGLENRRSCDTLPEYAPTSALPPPYSLLGLSPNQHAGIQTYTDMHNSSMSLAGIPPAGGSGMPLNRSYSVRGDSARNSNSVLNANYSTDSRNGLADFVYFPRKMN